MSTIVRSVHLDQPEPAPLSLRVPAGQETRLGVLYFDRLGNALSVDVLGQLELTPRTNGGPSQYFAVPATDVINGKAGAYIPAGTLTDPNGYRLTLWGTVRNEPALLAIGRVELLGAMAEGSAIPPSQPGAVIDRVDLTFERLQDVSLDVTLWQDTGKGAPYDLLNTAMAATIYDAQGGLPLVPFTVTVIAENAVRLTLTEDQVNALPNLCWWALVASTADAATTLCEGEVSVSGTVVPFPDYTQNWDYTRPDLADPAAGEIAHCNFTQNVIKVAVLSADAVDTAPTLSLVEVGDQIILGPNMWMINDILRQSDWFEFTVTPVVQSPVTGITPVTFRRPPV